MVRVTTKGINFMTSYATSPISPTALASPIPHPSLSRVLQLGNVQPRLAHSLHESDSSVLSLAANSKYIFSGNQSSNISVWDKETFGLKETLRGHTGSVLALEIAESRGWLFSASGDSTVRIWSTSRLTCLFVIDPYEETASGDLFCLSWSPRLETIFIGSQNTSLQWYDFRSVVSSGSMTPNSSMRSVHKFFDSYPIYQRKPADIYANNGSRSGTPKIDEEVSPIPHLTVPADNAINFAHFGYIYCIAIMEDKESESINIVTGSGDETIKLWTCTPTGLEHVHTFDCSSGAVYALIARRETIYAGCQDGHVKVIDAETRTLVRTIIVQEGMDILSLSMADSDLYTCACDGSIRRYSSSFDCTGSWQGHQGIILSSIVTTGHHEELQFVTAGNDDHIKVWDIDAPKRRLWESDFQGSNDCDRSTQEACSQLMGGAITFALSKFISIPSVSKVLSQREDCRQAAIWLKKCLIQLGASASLLSTGEGNNPLVFATFTGTKGKTPRRRILFYGHYDVIPAPPEGWNTDPFTLTGKNGYLYGRGATDNKGPILAVAYAAADLLYHRALGCDLVFLIEGEEERGSPGFKSAIKRHKDLIGDIDSIVVSNSTWIGEDRPCITYGLRGVIHATVEISSDLPDLHSGIDGGGITEPMADMVALLASLTDRKHRIRIPGFYDQVRPETKEEKELYSLLEDVTQKPASSLSSRWREPSLTVHTIEISGPKNAAVIPGTVKAQISLRIVPDQSLRGISESLCSYVQASFENLASPNKLRVNVDHAADWWLGEFEDKYFQALESAIEEEWETKPLRIREGGSIPSVPYLEKEFGCHAVHLPMGQSSDRAHLPNERISLKNLQKGRSVVQKFLTKISA